MNKKPFLIKQFPITKISELIGKKSTKTKDKEKNSNLQKNWATKTQNFKNPKQKRTQIYNNPSHKSKNSIKEKKKKRTQNLKREITNGGLWTVRYERWAMNGLWVSEFESEFERVRV